MSGRCPSQQLDISTDQDCCSPDVPYTNNRRSTPALRGRVLVASALLMEWSSLIRQKVWADAGFGVLRKISKLIEDYEPCFEPEIIPLNLAIENAGTISGGDRNGREGPHGQDHRAQSSATLTEASGVDGVARRPAVALEDGASETSVAKYPESRYYSAADYHALYLRGEITPLDVATTLLPLIRRDANPPGEHSVAFFETRENLVLEAARASTERYRIGQPLGPLDGVPTAVKDEYDMDGYSTCLGSRNDYTGKITEPVPRESQVHAPATTTSWLVRRLVRAGAMIIGKTSMHEFGLDTTGNNPWHGTPRNPHNPRYYTGGSSSGTGYAVSAGLIPIGLGSDGGGSIRIPSSMCGIFGLKPTHGRLSFKPGQNHCLTCSVLGPLAADVTSLATLFEVIAETHPSSLFPSMRIPLQLMHTQHPARPASRSSSKHIPETADLCATPRSTDDRNALSSVPDPELPCFADEQQPHRQNGRLLGVPEEWFARADPAVQRRCRALIDRLCAQENYEIVPITIPFLAEGQTAHAITVLTDAATLLPEGETSRLTAANRILLALGRTTPSTDYMLAQKLRAVIMRHLAWLWHEHPGMLIVTPTTACAGWAIRGGSGELRQGMSDGDRTLQSMEYAWMANFCGLPSVSVPAGFVDGEPGLKGGGEIPAGERVPAIGTSKRLGKLKVAASTAVSGRRDHEGEDDDDQQPRDLSNQVPVGLMAMGEWCSEERLLQFDKAAETVGEDLRRRPPVWVDVVEQTKATAAARRL